MKIWNITKKDLAVLLKDRTALIWMFVLPVVFIVLFAFLGARALQGMLSGDEGDQRVPLAVVNFDPEGELAKALIADLDRSQHYRVVVYSQAEADQALNTLKVARYLVIPANYSQELGQGKPVSLTLVSHPNDGASTLQPVVKLVQGVANDTSLELQLINSIRLMGEMQANNPQGETLFDEERVLAQAKSQFERASTAPLIGIRQRSAQEQATGPREEVDLSQSFVPGMTVLFVFLGASSVARTILEERKAGTLRRLLSSPLTRTEILLGKMLPVFLLTLLQIAAIFLAGAILLPLLGLGRLGIGNDPLGWAVTSIVMALCSTSLGIMLASITKTEGQVSGLSNAILWIAGFLGGALIPAFIIQSFPFLNFVSRLVPHTWANLAYYDLLAHGKSLVEVLPYLGVLCIFTAVFLFIGIRRFRFE
jgi:ABC-2 type transport system permease protein